MGLLLIATIITTVTSQLENSVNPPHGCLGFGYCYPDYRTANSIGETECTNCTCPSAYPKQNATTCRISASCKTNPCPSTGNWDCAIVGGQIQCSCQTGWTTDACDVEVTSPCATTPCLDRGRCTANIAAMTYDCKCDNGYTGNQCQYDNPCINYCKNGGACKLFDFGKTAYCECRFGFYGANCALSLTPAYDDVGCYDETNLGDLVTKGYYEAGAASSILNCYNKLVFHRKTVATSNYIVSSFLYNSKTCFFSAENKMTSKNHLFGCDSLIGGISGTDIYRIKDHPCDGLNCKEGVCIRTTASEASCLCPEGTGGSKCTSIVSLVSPCLLKNCGTGTCKVTDDKRDWYCSCPDGSSQKSACVVDPCSSRPCQNGGNCTAASFNYTCSCLNLYQGTNCEIFNSCYKKDCQNGGSCNILLDLLETTFNCSCTHEWRGELCEIEIMPCDTPHCLNGATCNNIINRPRNIKTFKCDCSFGYEGNLCQKDIDECVVYGPDLCTKKDKLAVCQNLLDGQYACNCSDDTWRGPNCTINKYIWEIVNSTYGYVAEDDLDRLTNELLSDPTAIRDLVPFLIGGYDMETRTKLSWDYDDIFLWVAYEEQVIDVRKDVIKWNDKVLGNCFTFNHENSSTIYKARMNGFAGGLELQTSIGSNEYLPWVETAAIMVFSHSTSESIFSESPRINCRGNHLVNMNLHPTQYERLGDKYGKCVKDKKEVASYYYTGSYTTDGCIRSCYQDVIKKECGCMDPRYPMPEDETVCGMGQRMCIDSIAEERGDPSKWSVCKCPLSCYTQQYDVTWSEQVLVQRKSECDRLTNSTTGNATSLRAGCYRKTNDMVLLKAGLPSLAAHTFVETPRMEIMTFLSQLGGLLSVLMGISIISFIEFGILFVQCGNVFCKNTRIKLPMSQNNAQKKRAAQKTQMGLNK